MYNKDTAVFLEENSFSLIPRITTKHSKQPPKSYTVKTLSYLTKGDSSSRIFSTTFNCTKHKKIKKKHSKTRYYYAPIQNKINSDNYTNGQ